VSTFPVSCLLAGMFVILASPAYAYLDPGTGSLILQGLIGGIAAGLAVISVYFRKIKAFILQLFGRPPEPRD